MPMGNCAVLLRAPLEPALHRTPQGCRRENWCSRVSPRCVGVRTRPGHRGPRLTVQAKVRALGAPPLGEPAEIVRFFAALKASRSSALPSARAARAVLGGRSLRCRIGYGRSMKLQLVAVVGLVSLAACGAPKPSEIPLESAGSPQSSAAEPVATPPTSTAPVASLACSLQEPQACLPACSAGDAKACFLAGQGFHQLPEGQRDDQKAVSAYQRGCDLGKGRSLRQSRAPIREGLGHRPRRCESGRSLREGLRGRGRGGLPQCWQTKRG
jgi:hypothetical protein